MKTLYLTFFNLLFVMSFVNGTAIQQFISGNNLFTADVYREIIKTNKGNILVSPLSVEIVLALSQSGAKGNTAQEIRDSLHLPNTKEETEVVVKYLLGTLKEDDSYVLHIANKIYIQSGLVIKQQFKQIASNIYQSEIENINFSQAEQAASVMNKWVEDHTNHKIHNLISPNDIDGSTLAVLINALHFKGDWQKPFSHFLTKNDSFYKINQETVEVNMMTASERSYNYYEDADLDATFLELPFKGQNISMVIALPNQRNGISILENRIDKVFVKHPFRFGEFDVAIPKFKFEETINFNEILLNLGVKQAFGGSADFSGIAGKQGDIYIDTVKQKSFIDVNEIGVEAAAASFVEMVFLSAPVNPPRQFIANHPFIFYIKHGDTILFAGKIMEPVQ